MCDDKSFVSKNEIPLSDLSKSELDKGMQFFFNQNII